MLTRTLGERLIPRPSRCVRWGCKTKPRQSSRPQCTRRPAGYRPSPMSFRVSVSAQCPRPASPELTPVLGRNRDCETAQSTAPIAVPMPPNASMVMAAPTTADDTPYAAQATEQNASSAAGSFDRHSESAQLVAGSTLTLTGTGGLAAFVAAPGAWSSCGAFVGVASLIGCGICGVDQVIHNCKHGQEPV